MQSFISLLLKTCAYRTAVVEQSKLATLMCLIWTDWRDVKMVWNNIFCRNWLLGVIGQPAGEVNEDEEIGGGRLEDTWLRLQTTWLIDLNKAPHPIPIGGCGGALSHRDLVSKWRVKLFRRDSWKDGWGGRRRRVANADKQKSELRPPSARWRAV